MQSQQHPDYFLKRAAEEREAAAHATSPKAEQAHLELAKRYADRVQGDGEERIEAEAPNILPNDFRILP